MIDQVKYLLSSIFITVLICLVNISCNNDAKDLVPKQTMINILVDIHLLEALIPESDVFDRDTSNALFAASRRKIFKKYKVDSVSFYTTYQYYIDHLEDFDELYTVIVDSLKSKSSSLEIGRTIDSSKESLPKLDIKRSDIDEQSLRDRLNPNLD